MKTHHGNCHCGAVQFTVEADITEAIRCNCSHCHRKGFVLAFIPKSQFTLEKGSETLTTYQFNKKAINHTFCKICGVQPFANSGDTMAININSLLDFDLSTISIKDVDGKNI